MNSLTTTSQFWLINLCNSIYKIISKILVSKRPSILGEINNLVQSAFMPKHSIHDNILLTHEIMNNFKNTKGDKFWLALKLYMKQVCDKVDDYLPFWPSKYNVWIFGNYFFGFEFFGQLTYWWNKLSGDKSLLGSHTIPITFYICKFYPNLQKL